MSSQAAAAKFSKAQEQLQLSFVPDVLPCREAQLDKLYGFLRTAIVKQQSDAIYISGVPGTGKTASVLCTVSRLRKTADLPPFLFVELNGLKVGSPTELFVQLWKYLSKEKLSPAQAQKSLDGFFSDPEATAGGNAAVSGRKRKSADRRPFTVVMLDEVDQVVQKNQEVIYNMFNWPTLQASRLVVVGITNSNELPQLISLKVGSRMGLKRIPYKPYSPQELTSIIESRLANVNVFEDSCIASCCNRVAATSGDVRRALELCRSAVAIAEQAGVTSVREEHLELALRAISPEATRLAVLRSMPEHQQALLFLLARGSATAMSYFDVFDALEFFYNCDMFSTDKVVSDLVECGFLHVQERDRNRMQWQLSLKIPREFVMEQLKSEDWATRLLAGSKKSPLTGD
jgi:origin recognition complex subunit 1